MNVKELIARLQDINPEALVIDRHNNECDRVEIVIRRYERESASDNIEVEEVSEVCVVIY